MSAAISTPPMRRAFTLIELLIVVAIIAILAAIAVPNFLEAQTRSKVTRTKADLRTIATAMESYYVDNNRYPEEKPLSQDGFLSTISGVRLTTPIAYITSLDPVRDVFNKQENLGVRAGFEFGQPFLYGNYNEFFSNRGFDRDVRPDLFLNGWAMVSFGPDNQNGQVPQGDPANRALIQVPPTAGSFPGSLYEVDPATGAAWVDSVYDPTNGTISGGDIGRAGGEVPAEALVLFEASGG